jgi:hypothetical protein
MLENEREREKFETFRLIVSLLRQQTRQHKLMKRGNASGSFVLGEEEYIEILFSYCYSIYESPARRTSPNFSESLKALEIPRDFPLELTQKTSSFLPSPFHNTVVASYLCCRHVTNISWKKSYAFAGRCFGDRSVESSRNDVNEVLSWQFTICSNLFMWFKFNFQINWIRIETNLKKISTEKWSSIPTTFCIPARIFRKKSIPSLL